MLTADKPALILAPMDGITDAPMRAFQGETGAFSFAVSEFLRVSQQVPPRKVFYRHVPELCHGGRTPSGMPIQVQLLGGDAGRMAAAAVIACEAGAMAIDINFGCPAPTVNRHDGGATLLRHPVRIREIVRAVRTLVPADIPVSAKLRLGWDDIDAIHENADMAAEGGASWLTIHARTRIQGYAPPVYWQPIGQVRERLNIPVVANGDIWSLDEFKLCRDQTGCSHFMLGRGALADPRLPIQIAVELGTMAFLPVDSDIDWVTHLRRLAVLTELFGDMAPRRTALRLKQWLRIASHQGNFPAWVVVKRAETCEEIFAILGLSGDRAADEAR